MGSHSEPLYDSESAVHAAGMIFRKEPFFYGHDNYDQLVKIAKVRILMHPLGGPVYLGEQCPIRSSTAGKPQGRAAAEA